MKDEQLAPFSAAQRKAHAKATKIKPESCIRKGRRGQWVRAKNVRGLLPQDYLFRLFDHTFAWLGGNYKLVLPQYDDENLVIWQVNHTADYEANLTLLQAVGLRVG